MINDRDERLFHIKLAINGHELCLSQAFGWLAINRGENSTIHRHEMRRKNHFDRAAGEAANDLFDFWRVAMLSNTISRDALVALAVKKIDLRISASPRDAALRVDDNISRFD